MLRDAVGHIRVCQRFLRMARRKRCFIRFAFLSGNYGRKIKKREAPLLPSKSLSDRDSAVTSYSLTENSGDLIPRENMHMRHMHIPIIAMFSAL